MKKVSELGLELIELEDQVLLIDKNSKIEKGDLFEFDTLICIYDGTYHLGAGREHKIIASTKPLEGLPLLVIEDEAHELSKEYLDATSYEKESDDQFIGRYSGFVSGYNKAKETYKFTEEDLGKVIDMAKEEKLVMVSSGGGEEDHYRYKDKYSKKEIIQSLTKKELWIQTTISLYKGNGTYGMEIPKITNNQIKAVWK